MDLLGAYDSSSDDESHDDNHQYQESAKLDVNKTSDQGNSSHRREDLTNIKNTTAIRHPTVALSRNAPSDTSRPRDKKLLSLAAILPSHIWDQLTKAQVGQDDDDDDDDDDLEGDAAVGHTRKQKNPASVVADESVPSSTHLHHQPREDAALVSLLSDLKAAPRTNSIARGHDTSLEFPPPTTSPLSAAKSITADQGTAPSKAAASIPKPLEKLGVAFLAVTTTTTTTTRPTKSHSTTNASATRDIHAERSDHTPLSNNNEATITLSTAMVPASTTRSSEGVVTLASMSTNTTAATAAAVTTNYPTSTTTARTTTFMGVHPRTAINAAPKVIMPPHYKTSTMTTTTTMAAVDATTQPTDTPPLNNPPWLGAGSFADATAVTSATSVGTTIGAPTSSTSRKRSRQELEKALRLGKMDAIQNAGNDGIHTTFVEQAHPDQYVPQPQSYAAIPAHGIKVVPTAMYDPTSGHTITAMPSTNVKGRSKNQIHHIMASAAQLELQRARNLGPGGGLGGSAGGNAQQNQSLHRANAKQKYGW